jgi:chemotaxis protein methyltransferase CheR
MVGGKMISIDEKEFIKLVDYIKSNFGINLIQKKTLVEGRLNNYISECGFNSFSAYLDKVFQDRTGKEITNLINKLTTNHTFFMRESQHYEFLVKTILPYLEQTVKDKDIRIWSAGCSSGEEPYTTAMVLMEYFGDKKTYWDTRILATDISQNVLGQAISGIYPAAEVEELPSMWKLNYFTKIDKESYRISDKIKDEVTFRIFNLMSGSFPFKKRFHLIFCRNVMIYFDQPTKEVLFKKYYDFTEPGGYLFIGHSESMGKENPGYNYICPAIYRKPL